MVANNIICQQTIINMKTTSKICNYADLLILKSGIEYLCRILLLCLVFCMLCRNVVYSSEDHPSVTWDYVLETTGIANEKILMRACEVLHYREYDVNDFVRNRNEYGDSVLFWLAEKNTVSGRLQVAEIVMKMLLGKDPKFLPEHTYPYAYALLGAIQFALEKNAEAAVAFDSAIKTGNQNVYVHMACVSFMLDDHKTVKKMIPELMKRKRTDTEALATLLIISQKTNDVKLFKESIDGLDDSFFTVNSRTLMPVIQMLRVTGDQEDLLRAGKLQKKLDEMLCEQPLNQRIAKGAEGVKPEGWLRDLLAKSKRDRVLGQTTGSVPSSCSPAVNQPNEQKPTEPTPTSSGTMKPTTHQTGTKKKTKGKP